MVEFSFPVTPDEPARLEALRSYNVLDTAPEKEFDDLTRLAAHAAGCPFAAITLVDAERQWYKARVGFDLTATPRSSNGFCSNAILVKGPSIVPDVEADPRFEGSPAVDELGIRFYAGVPLVNCENLVLGTLCVLDRVPRQITPEQVDALVVIARQVMAQLELRRLASVGEFRERLVSILREDLRQPLQQILLTARQGLRPLVASPEQRYVEQIALTAERLTRVVRDVLDFTQTRLGTGLSVLRRPATLSSICRRVVHEFALSYAGREIHLEVLDEGAGLWDEDRIGQAVSNLVANALRYGAPSRPVRLIVSASDGECTIAVHNEGNPIPPSVMARLFSPFCRDAARGPGVSEAAAAPISGVGLGLFIVREIARACGGSVDATSSSDVGTAFRIHLPRENGDAEAYRPTFRQ